MSHVACRMSNYNLCVSQFSKMIRDFPDNATFREKSVALAWSDKLGVLEFSAV